MNTAIYLRKSRAEETTATVEDTLQRHKETLLDFAKNNHLTIIHIYEEVVSGESLYARPEMLKLLSDVENGKYDAVLCMDIDRLGRGAMSDQGIILETFKASDTKIITLRKVYDLNNEFDEEYTEFETFIARRELSLIKRRMRRGIERTVLEGAYIPNAPYGYKKTKEGKHSTLENYEPEAKFVRLIFDMYVNQGMGAQSIAENLNRLGAKPHRSAEFARTSVLKMIRNQVYIGKVVWNQFKRVKNQDGSRKAIPLPKEDWVVVDGIHPPIIDPETFDMAQKILSERYHTPHNTGVLHNPLSGLMICDKCGKQMVRRKYTTFGNRQRAVNFICITRGCTPYDRMEAVEKSVIDSLYNRFMEIKSMTKNQPKNTSDSEALALAAIEQEQSTCEAQLDRLHDFLEQGVYDIDTFLKRSSLLNDKLKKLKQQKEELQLKQEQSKSDDKSYLLPAFENLFKNYWSSNPGEKNQMLKNVVDHINYRKEHNADMGDFELKIFLK